MLLLGSSVTVSAAGTETPASIVAHLTGRDINDVIREKLDTGKTYGTIAKEYGKLNEFKEECLKIKEQSLKEDVANGLLTAEEADEILTAIKANQTTCNGTGSGICWNKELQPGNGNNSGNGRNQCHGYSRCLTRAQSRQNISRTGRGNQNGRRQGVCYNSCIFN